MATNLKKDNDRIIANVAATHPATPTTGQPVVLGKLPGVALTDEGEGGNDSAKITMDTGGIYTLSVVGSAATAASAVAIGDRIYYDNGVLNKDVTNGTAYGFALGTVSSGGTSSIDVKIQGA